MIVAVIALAALGGAQPAHRDATTDACEEVVRFGLFDAIAPISIAATTAWLDDAPRVCFGYYRERSGPDALLTLAHGDYDIALMGSTVFTTAIERGVPVSAVGILALPTSSEGLATRAGLGEPRSLRGSTLATVRGSTAHYHLEAFLHEMTIDARDVTIVFGQYVEIMRLWDAGKIDGAACWAPCLDHVLTKPHGGTGAPGALLYDAETLLRWGFGTGIVIVAHDDFISRRPDVVQRVVERSIRAANDYRTNRDGPDWTAGRFADAAGRFLAMDLGNETTVPAAFVVNQLGRTEWPDTRTQIGFLEIGIESLQHQAAFSFAQKDLAEPPYEDPSIYLPHIGASFLRAVTTETVPLDAEPDPVPDFIPYAVRAQLPVPGEGCEPFSVIDGDATFDDGSTGENAYARNANCVWALRAPATGCVVLEVPFLSSEALRDRVDIFSAAGDLRASFSGRRRGKRPTTVGCVVPDAPPGVAAALVGGAAPNVDSVALYVRWSTDGYDERAMGAIEPVGFRATARAFAGDLPTCGPGRGGALCDSPCCVGVVDVTGEGGVIKTQVADDAYEPNLRCGWRIPARGGRVVLDVARLGLERVRDVVTIYDGGAAPPGFNTLARPPPVDVFGRTNELSRRTRYRMSGTHAPSTPLVFDNDVFVTFESDGIANGPRDGGPAGLEIRWRRDVVDGDLCPEAASCGRNGRCEEGVCVCDPGYYGETCAFDACVGAAVSDLAPSGRIVSSAGVDYPPDMNCEWFLDIPGREGEGIAGIRLRFDRFDIESPEGQAATTDRVAVVRLLGPDQGVPLVAFRRNVQPGLTSSVGVAYNPVTDETSYTFDDGDTVEVLLPEPAPAGETVRLALAFATDANNHGVEYRGFDVTYGVAFDGPAFCDERWPCAEGEVCEDDRCVDEKPRKSKHSRSRRQLRRMKRGVIVAMIVFACVIGLAFCVFGGIYGARVVRTKDELETERVRVVRDQVDSARQWVNDFQAPFVVVAGSTFVALGELMPHEALRDGPRHSPDGVHQSRRFEKQHTKLEFYDSVYDVERARDRGAVFVFLSHQWLGHSHPDPAGIHYKAMCRALQAVAEDAGVALSAVRAWVDVSSIPQANQATQSLAVASLPTFASCVDYFIVVAPDTEHVTTGCGCDAATYRKRAWCRAEVVACWARRGADRMFVATNRGLRPLFVETGDGADTYLEECLEVFAGDLTCCRLCHPDGEPCDKEALVPPFLGLVGELYGDRKQRPEAWAKVRDRADELFPRTFSYESGGVTTTLPLFGDLIEAILRLVDSEGTDGASPEPVLRGLAPGTTGQRHVAKAHRRSPHQHSRHLVATAPHSGDGSTLRGSRDAGSLRGSPGVLFRALSDRVVRRSPPAALRELPTASPAVTERSTAATVATAASAATVATTETPRDNWASSPPASPWSSTSLWSSSRSPESKTGSSERRLTWALPTGRAERPRVSTVSLQPVLPTVEDV